MKKYITLFATLLIMASCQVKTPEEIIQPDQMESILYDYHQVQAMGNDMNGSPQYHLKLYFEYVFKKHGVTKELFDSSMVWYTRHPSYLSQMYANLQEQYDYEVAEMQDERGLEKVARNLEKDYSADTLELWTGRDVEHITSVPLNNRRLFSFESDSAFITGDSVAFEFSTRFFSEKVGAKQGLHTALLVGYTDNSNESMAAEITQSGRFSLQFIPDYDRTIKEIRGFIYYTDNDSTTKSGVVLSDIYLTRIHPPVDDGEESEE